MAICDICEFGLYIKMELIKKQMTQRDLSKNTGIDEKVISDIIYGRNTKQEHKDKIRLALSSEA